MRDCIFKILSPEYDPALAELIRKILKAHALDIPGTVYFDEGLDHLSGYYSHGSREYFVLTKNNKLIGGIGYAEFGGFERCAELQKLYLDDSEKGNGIGYEMIRYIEDRAREAGYLRMYLETHTNLQAAIHIYEKSGYKEIERLSSVVHSTMNRFYLKKL
ncbi:MAG: GNAT family N-acetyltransferase [Lachnospiraceae bacterium]|nr:GNAT family N-acetyltransferase [Lachnospiraceae bacterium]